MTLALPTPVPTRAPRQRLRAWPGFVPSSFFIVQTGTPLRAIEPCLSTWKTTVFSAAGWVPPCCLTRIALVRLTGASRLRGSSWGSMSALALTTLSPYSPLIVTA